MAGIYFMAAGGSSLNRKKSLDLSIEVAGVKQYLNDGDQEQFQRIFGNAERVYAWGANKQGNLDKLVPGDYVVDVKNKLVVQIFQYGFVTETQDTNLQEWIGWDSEKPVEERRPYRFVYFLHSPQKTIHEDKAYFQRAFAQEGNQNWLVGQRWFGDDVLRSAIERTKTHSVEKLLGIGTSRRATIPPKESVECAPPVEPEQDLYLRPEWLLPVIEQIETLQDDPDHLEREHEDAVAHLFEKLGYSRGREIKFQRGRVDILISEEGKPRPSIVVEVKRDWTISRKSMNYVRQAHNYALEVGARWAILTNGDRYIIYDRENGLSYDEQLDGEFELTSLSSQGLQLLTRMNKGSLR